MNKLFLSLALVASSPVAVAQNCFDGDFGTLLGTSVQDWVSPMQVIGFPFPLGGTTYTNIHISDHGLAYLSNAGVPVPPATNDPVLYTPTTVNLMAGSPKVCVLYADIIATGGGTIYISSSPTECVITWRSMQNFGFAALRFNFQIALYPSGLVRFVWGPGCTNNSTFGGSSDNGIVGVSVGGAAALPPAVDLSAGGATIVDTTYENWTLPLTFDMASNTLLMVGTAPGYTYTLLGAPAACAATSNYGTGCDGLAMTGRHLPSLGNSNFILRLSTIPVVSPVAFVGFGDVVVTAGIPLGFLGIPLCSAYTNMNIGLFTSGPVVSGVSDFPLAIPSTPSIVGTLMSAQGVSLSLVNPAFPFATSNGTQILIGNGY